VDRTRLLLIILSLGLLWWAFDRITHADESDAARSPIDQLWDQLTKGREPIPASQLFGNWLDIFPLDRAPYPASEYSAGDTGGGFAGGGGGGW